MGPTGTGKTRSVFQQAPDAYAKMANNIWWDGYDGDDNVLLDEYNSPWFTWNYLLRLLDRYPMLVEVKGGTVQFVARRIFITCNRDPREWYDRSHLNKYPVEALLRRIDEIRVFEREPETSMVETTKYSRTEEHDGIKEWADCHDLEAIDQNCNTRRNPIPASEWE